MRPPFLIWVLFLISEPSGGSSVAPKMEAGSPQEQPSPSSAGPTLTIPLSHSAHSLLNSGYCPFPAASAAAAAAAAAAYSNGCLSANCPCSNNGQQHPTSTPSCPKNVQAGLLTGMLLLFRTPVVSSVQRKWLCMQPAT